MNLDFSAKVHFVVRSGDWTELCEMLGHRPRPRADPHDDHTVRFTADSDPGWGGWRDESRCATRSFGNTRKSVTRTPAALFAGREPPILEASLLTTNVIHRHCQSIRHRAKGD